MDLSQTAARVVRETLEGGSPTFAETPTQQNGRTGGVKGGPVRAAKLSTAERGGHARKVARARWAKRKDS